MREQSFGRWTRVEAIALHTEVVMDGQVDRRHIVRSHKVIRWVQVIELGCIAR